MKGPDMFKRGDIVEILQEFQDVGDSTFTWIVLHDEEKGRVDITPIDIELQIKPTYTLKADQIKLSTLTLAREFSDALRALLTPAEMREVISRNLEETHPSICHTHDFCDANVLMHEVFLSHGMNPVDEGGMDKWGHLWTEAWNLAKAHEFDFN
jgi:hypothetical protein